MKALKLGLLLVCASSFVASSLKIEEASLLDEGVSLSIDETKKTVLGRKWSDLVALQEAEIAKARSTDHPMMAYLDHTSSSFFEGGATQVNVQVAQANLQAAQTDLQKTAMQAASITSGGAQSGWDRTFSQLKQQLPGAASVFGPMTEVGLRAASAVETLGQGSENTKTMGVLAMGGHNGLGMLASDKYMRTCPNFAQETTSKGESQMTTSDKLFMGQGQGADFTIRANANLKVAYVTFPAVHDITHFTLNADPVMVDMEGCHGGKAHEGFWNLASLNYRNIKLREALLSFVKKGYNVNFDGHGVGGAISILFVWMIASDPSLGLNVNSLKVITYGAPNMLNEQGADCYAAYSVTGKIMRWNIDGDPVPLLPESLTSVGYTSILPSSCEFMDKVACHKTTDYLNAMYGMKSFQDANPSTKDNQCFSSMGGVGAMNSGPTNSMIGNMGAANQMIGNMGAANLGGQGIQGMALQSAMLGGAASAIGPANNMLLSGQQNGINTQGSMAAAASQGGNPFLGHTIRDLNGQLAKTESLMVQKLGSMTGGNNNNLNAKFQSMAGPQAGGTAPATASLPHQQVVSSPSAGPGALAIAGAGGMTGGTTGGMVASARSGGQLLAGVQNMNRIQSDPGMAGALNQGGALGGVGLGIGGRANDLNADLSSTWNDPGQKRLNEKVKEEGMNRLNALGFGPQIIPEKPALCNEEGHKDKGYCNFQMCNLKCEQFPYEEFCANCRQIWVPRGGPKGFNEALEKAGHHVPISLQSTAHAVSNAAGDDQGWDFPNQVNNGLDDMDLVLLQKKRSTQNSLSPHTTTSKNH